MKIGIRFRLTALALAVGVMGGLIGLATLNSQRQAAELRARLNQVDSESFGIADQFKDAIREVGDKMLRYRTGREPADWDEFLTASRDLEVWLEAQKPRLNTEREKQVLREIAPAYAEYLRVALEVHDRVQALAGQNGAMPDFTGVFAPPRRRLVDLGQDLARAHYASRNRLVAQATQSLTQLRRMVLGSLCLLFVFGVALASVVYRDMIAPLRVKLVESQALAERHEKLASLGMLAAGVAHEIRNPLTAIKAALFLQQKNFPHGTPERADSQLIEREILRLERIVNDFLQFARPSEPELTTVPVDLLLRESQLIFTPQLAKANIQLVREESPPMRVHVDPAQIKQVLINLVQNAAESIGHDGTITLRAQPSRKSLSNAEAEVVILEVADTGKGIPPEIGKRLFDPFFTTKDNGTGLGLAIAARIVQKHGGLLQYQTQLNHGTTFGIILPKV